MTINIRVDDPADGPYNWAMRKDRVAKAIKFYDADIVGAQEVMTNQCEDLKKRLPEYTVIGANTANNTLTGECNALMFKTDRFDVEDSGTFWLSDTPDVTGSMGWDGACIRVAVWARISDKYSGNTVFALNTHLDHVGKIAQNKGIELILKKVDELSQGAPIIVTGDFNSTPESDVVTHITDTSNPDHLTDSRTVSEIVYGPDWSFHNFGRLPIERRTLIDYVFIRGNIDVDRYGSLAETENNEYISDHNPILVTISIP